MWSIYRVHCKTSNKFYIGVTSRSLDYRWQQHQAQSFRDGHRGILQNAIRKYGPDQFSVTLLCQAYSINDAAGMEKAFISVCETLYPQGYNMTTGGDGLDGTGKKVVRSEAHRRALAIAVSASNKRRALPPEEVDRRKRERQRNEDAKKRRKRGVAELPKSREELAEISRHNLKKAHTSEARMKMAQTLKGRKRTSESIAKTASFHVGRKRSPLTRIRISEAAQSRILTHCHNGHEYTLENTTINYRGHRACRICRRAKRDRQRRC